MKTKTLETKYVYEGKIYVSPQDIEYRIGSNNIHFLEQLRDLPTSEKIHLMNISLSEIFQYLDDLYLEKAKELKSVLKTNWVWRITGYDMTVDEWDDVDVIEGLFDRRLTKKQILGKLKRRTLAVGEIILMLSYFHEQDDLMLKD